MITSAFAFAFDGDRIPLAHIAKRGWSALGGHREGAETPEETARREAPQETARQEAAEEAGARLGVLRPFAYQRISIGAPRPDGYLYPYPDSFQVFFLTQVKGLDPFTANEETLDRRLVPPSEARALPWIGRNRDLYEAALAATAIR